MTKACPMYMRVHDFLRCISIGIFQASGFRLVPEFRFIRYVAGDNAGVFSTSWPRKIVAAHKTAKTIRPFITPLPKNRSSGLNGRSLESKDAQRRRDDVGRGCLRREKFQGGLSEHRRFGLGRAPSQGID